MAQEYHNYSLRECDQTLAQYEREINSGRMTFHQKFTCAQCWARITVREPNTLFELGHCEECGWVTDLQATGCNYLVIKRVRPQ